MILMRILYLLLHLKYIFSACTSGPLNYNGVNTTYCNKGVDVRYLSNTFYPSSVPTPTVNMAWNSVTNSLVFTTSVKYLGEDCAWVIRFSAYNNLTDSINLPGSCENRLKSTYNSLTFSNYWTHRGNANYSNSLNSATYPNYYANNKWTLSAIDCANIQYVGSFTIPSLQTCTNPQNVKEVYVMNNGNYGITTIRGNLVASMVVPIYSSTCTGNKAGTIAQSWVFPFQYTVAVSSTNSILLSSNNDYIYISLTDMGTYDTTTTKGYLYMTITYTYYTAAFGLVGPCSFYSSNNNVNMTLVYASPSYTIQSSPVVQVCSYSSTTTQIVYDGVYNFYTTLYDCTSNVRSKCTAVSNIIGSANIAVTYNQLTNTTYNFGTYVATFTDNTFTNYLTSSPIEGNQVCFQDIMNVGTGDQGLYGLSLQDVYICSPDNQTNALSYDGVNTFGCLNVSSSTPLVIQGSIDPSNIGNFVSNYYNPTLYSFSSGWKTGLCINAMSKFMYANGTLNRNIYKFYIQFSVKVSKIASYNGEKITDRNVHNVTLIHSQHIIGGQVIEINQDKKKRKEDEFPNRIEGLLNGLTFFVLKKNESKKDSVKYFTREHIMMIPGLKGLVEKNHGKNYTGYEGFHFIKKADMTKNKYGIFDTFTYEMSEIDPLIYIILNRLWLVLPIILSFIYGSFLGIYKNRNKKRCVIKSSK